MATSAPGRPTGLGFGLVTGACAAIAAVSLLLPFEPVFDAWAWLIWGREGLDLDTGGGPSWKPLPVLFTAPISLAGDAAPDLWLLVARTGWLLCLPLAWMLGRRVYRRLTELGLAPGESGAALFAAGALAALSVALIDDAQTPWLRQFAGGLSEPMLLALVLAAAECHLRGRRRVVLALLLAASLLRPETWILFAPYAWWLWSREPAFRPFVALSAVAIPILWFLPDVLASGSVATGVNRAAAPAGGLGRLPDATKDVLLLAPLGLLFAAAWATVESWRRCDRLIPALALAAVAWLVTVLGLTMLGFAGLARFGIVFGGAVAIVGSAALVAAVASLVGQPRRPAGATALVAVVALATAVGLGLRVGAVPSDVRGAADFADTVHRQRDLVAAVGAERIAACGRVMTTEVLTETALTWELELAMSQLRLAKEMPATGVVFVDPAKPLPSVAGGTEVAQQGGLVLYETSCPTGTSLLSGTAEDGVSGASR